MSKYDGIVAGWRSDLEQALQVQAVMGGDAETVIGQVFLRAAARIYALDGILKESDFVAFAKLAWSRAESDREAKR